MVFEKKTDSGPDFRLARSRHPSASGRRIGSSPGDGWAARRDPEANVRVFYGAGSPVAEAETAGASGSWLSLTLLSCACFASAT